MFLSVLTMFGCSKGLTDLAGLTNEDSSIPRQYILILIIGGINIASGLLFGPAFTVSVEAASGIRGGARTGLSAVFCGCLFFFAMFFGPFFTAIPNAATSPVLITVGMLMFMNVKRIDFDDLKYAFPAFCTLFFIAFTSSTLAGLVIGYCCYIFLSIFTLDIVDNTFDILKECFPNYFGPDITTVKVDFEDGKTMDVPVPVHHDDSTTTVVKTTIDAPIL